MATSHKPPKSASTTEPPKQPYKFKHLREISLEEAKKRGMFTEPVMIISPQPKRAPRARAKGERRPPHLLPEGDQAHGTPAQGRRGPGDIPTVEP